MKEQLLNYFKSYQIDVDQLLDSGNRHGSLEIKDPRDYSSKIFLLNYKIDHDNNETAFFFWCINDKHHKEWFHHFSNGIKHIVKTCKAVLIEKPGPEKEWYGWSDHNPPVGYAVKNEPLSFTVRILIPKNF